jgi:sigma-E factor negative regulatory protein RseC
LKKPEPCAHCAAKGACEIGTDKKARQVEALNSVGAHVGDQVRMETSVRKFMQSSLLLYGLPMVFLLVGAIIGNLVGTNIATGDPNTWALLGGVGSFIFSLFLIRFCTRGVSKEAYMPQIVRILEREAH